MEKKWKYELKIVLYYNYGCSYNIYSLAILRLSKRKCDFVFPSKNLSFGLIQEVKNISTCFPKKKNMLLFFQAKIHFGFVSASEKLYAVVV